MSTNPKKLRTQEAMVNYLPKHVRQKVKYLMQLTREHKAEKLRELLEKSKDIIIEISTIARVQTVLATTETALALNVKAFYFHINWWLHIEAHVTVGACFGKLRFLN